MKAMILAAGLGTRLKPFTDTKPKALLPLAGKTILQWQIERLKAAGITEIVVNIHHFGQQIIDYLNDNQGFGCHIQISDERDALLETGGGLLKAADLLGNQEPVLVCNVDILSNIDLPALIRAHTDNPSLATLVVSARETQRYFLFAGDGTLRGWWNKKTGEVKPATLAGSATDAQRAESGQLLIDEDLVPMAYSGMQIVQPAFFEQLRLTRDQMGDKFSVVDALLGTIYRHAGVIRAFVPRNYRMMDVGKIEQLSEAERFALELQNE